MSKRIGFSNDHGDGRCIDCNSPTFLLSVHDFWAINEEPIKNGQLIEEIENAELQKLANDIYSDGIELGTEITCHFCPKCRHISSINVNWD